MIISRVHSFPNKKLRWHLPFPRLQTPAEPKIIPGENVADAGRVHEGGVDVSGLQGSDCSQNLKLIGKALYYGKTDKTYFEFVNLYNKTKYINMIFLHL
jgi:hypothetical protein